MDIYNMLLKINELFPSNEPKEIFEKRMENYFNLVHEKEKEKNQKINYEKTLSNFIENYPYKNFPNYTEISKYFIFNPKEEQKVLKKPRKFKVYLGKNVYFFEEVFWDKMKKAHCLSDFDKYEEIFDD